MPPGLRVAYFLRTNGHPHDRLLVELKCTYRLADEHLAQCINYLTASGLHLAVLINSQHPPASQRRVAPGRSRILKIPVYLRPFAAKFFPPQRIFQGGLAHGTRVWYIRRCTSGQVCRARGRQAARLGNLRCPGSLLLK